MQDERNQSRQTYRGPTIVDVGAVVMQTKTWKEPVRDNPGAGTPAYYNSAKEDPGCLLNVDDL